MQPERSWLILGVFLIDPRLPSLDARVGEALETGLDALLLRLVGGAGELDQREAVRAEREVRLLDEFAGGESDVADAMPESQSVMDIAESRPSRSEAGILRSRD